MNNQITKIPCFGRPGFYSFLATLLCMFTCTQAQTKPAQTPLWLLTGNDLTHHQLHLNSISNGAILGIDPATDQAITWKIADIVELERADTPSAPASSAQPFALYLPNANRILGRPLAIANDRLQWQSPLLGKFLLPLTDIRAIVRSDDKIADHQTSRDQDTIHLKNGDHLGGIVLTADTKAVGLSHADSPAPASIPWDSIAAVYFAAMDEAKPAQPVVYAKVTLRDGSVINIRQLQGTPKDGWHWTGVFSDTTSNLPFSAITRIEFPSESVRWLSSLPPIVNQQIPYLPGAATRPARMNQTVDGEPLRADGRTYHHGIGVHAFSRLSFDIPPGYKIFQTHYILGAGKYANVVVRILLDDQVVYQAADAQPGKLSQRISLPLNAAHRLTLEVDYGQMLDVQDRFDWIEPVLLK